MLTFRDMLRVSVRQVIRQHRRSLGVGLAITLGTTGFIVVMTTGRDVKKNLSLDLELLGGATVVKVYFERNPHFEYSFRPGVTDDLRRLRGVSGVSALACKNAPASTITDDQRHTFTVVGVDEFFWAVNGFEPVAGRLFSAEDVTARRRVCVLGADLARRLFGHHDVSGRKLLIDKDLHTVTGTIEGGVVGDRTHYAFVPLTTAQDRLEWLSPPNRLYIRCVSWDDVKGVAAAAPNTVRAHQDIDGLQVEVAWEQLRRIQRIVWWVELFIYTSIAATLILGGFGIWNGMMASVQARTREIGLKKAMGAVDGDIMSQFLAEALCLSLGSAFLGIVGGRFAIQAISSLLQSSPPEDLFLTYMGMSLLFSVVLGVGAGFYPAIRASRMEVVTAMRYE